MHIHQQRQTAIFLANQGVALCPTAVGTTRDCRRKTEVVARAVLLVASRHRKTRYIRYSSIRALCNEVEAEFYGQV